MQILDDLLTDQFSQKQAYSVLAGRPGVAAETVLGFKYLALPPSFSARRGRNRRTYLDECDAMAGAGT